MQISIEVRTDSDQVLKLQYLYQEHIRNVIVCNFINLKNL